MPKKQNAKFEVHNGIGSKHFFNIVSPEGKILSTSTEYESRRKCIDAIDAIVELMFPTFETVIKSN